MYKQNVIYTNGNIFRPLNKWNVETYNMDESWNELSEMRQTQKDKCKISLYELSRIGKFIQIVDYWISGTGGMETYSLMVKEFLFEVMKNVLISGDGQHCECSWCHWIAHLSSKKRYCCYIYFYHSEKISHTHKKSGRQNHGMSDCDENIKYQVI